MMNYTSDLPLSLIIAIFILTRPVLAGFDPGSKSNIAVYWGQNSKKLSTSQQRLSSYCSNSAINIITLAFMNGVETPVLNFANNGDSCSVIAGTQLLSCPQIEEDIKTCQDVYQKTILLSLGGALSSDTGFPDPTSTATDLWNMFGPNTAYTTRPFGTAIIDGFDFDFEVAIENVVPFAKTLRGLMDGDTSKKYYLSAAPQCPYPDVFDGGMLNAAVSFDFIMVQFYNNPCGVSSFTDGANTQGTFNFQTWDNWASQISKNKNVKIFLGIPAASEAGHGYVSAEVLAPIITYCRQQFSSFGGVMIWDMSQLFANTGFLDSIYASLVPGGQTIPGGQAVPGPSATTLITSTAQASPTMATSTTSEISTAAVTVKIPSSLNAALIPQWEQCGGNGYLGSTACQPPYTCVTLSVWWAQCE